MESKNSSVLTSVGDVVTTTSFIAVGPGPNAHLGAGCDGRIRSCWQQERILQQDSLEAKRVRNVSTESWAKA
jgi:uncharacterized protein (UPF0218 family)